MPRPFDWRALLDEQRVPYVERGANVKRGEVNIRCPFCGAADPSYHLGLNLETGFWACWRNNTHRGKSPIRLLMRMLNASYARACEIAGVNKDYVDPEGFDAAAARIMGRDKKIERPEQVRRRHLSLDEFEPVTERIRTRRHWNYLYQRGFGENDIQSLCESYSLRAGVSGPQSDRIVLPYIVNGDVVAWSGRAIGKATIRYRDLDHDDCLIPPKETLFNHDGMLTGGRVLVIVEGPFDALKLDFYGRDFGVRAVALSTNSISEQQVLTLRDAEDRFDRVLSMMDSASVLGVVDSMRLKQELWFLDVRAVAVPFGAKDAGDLTVSQVARWCDNLR